MLSKTNKQNKQNKKNTTVGWTNSLQTLLNVPYDSLKEQRPICLEVQHNCRIWPFSFLYVLVFLLRTV